ncbi:MAG TPA: prolipoprotein diacylglyceryl transferase [Syntrophomonadaceae bacterium]|nr:prolipoprotein diacylglyceryl transferase [Syntrophomonadaceae bacterium]HRX20877.1 prolipoprotein diacylglyceryl transferase [Syntrophomonadaceae bacterium]
MYPTLFEVGPITVNSWGLMLAIAVIISIFGVGRLFEREGYDKEIVLDMVLIMVIAGIFGSRLAYVLIYQWQEFWHNPAILFALQDGGIAGLVWYGALIGGFLSFIIYIRIKKLDAWRLLDMFAPYVAFSYALVRIGCFLAGCCYGEATSCSLGVVFPNVDSLPRHPTQLYSSLINFILFAFLLWYFPRRKFAGEVFALYIGGYAVYRLIIEFFRENIIFYGAFTLGQVFSFFLLVFALVLYVLRSRAARIEAKDTGTDKS